MNVIDLTHALTNAMPVYPGDPEVGFALVACVPDDGYDVTKMSLSSHTGTHIDVPAHLVAGAKTLADFPVSHFMGFC